MPQYTYRTYDLTSNGDHYWIAESLQLKGCIGEGDTERDAIKELAENEKEWVLTAQEMGIPVPAPAAN